jgi:hypothetical protein
MNRMGFLSLPRPGLRALAVLLLSVSGCVSPEGTEIVAERVDKSSAWTLTYTFDGLFSDSDDPEVQRRDFLDVVHSWKEAPDVDPRVETVIDRKVWVSKEGRLMGLMKMRVRRPEDLFETSEWIVDSLGYHLHVPDPNTVVQTNGRIEHREGTIFVTWPPRARRLAVKAKTTSTSPRGNLVPYYQAYVESTAVSK